MTERTKDGAYCPLTTTNEASNGLHLATPVVSTPRDVDGGWAWVVLATAFLSRVVQGGLFWSMNFYFVAYHDAFGESRTYTSMIGALAFASFHSSSPFSSFAIQKLGVRATAIIGSLLVAINFLLNIHATGVLYLIITHAIFFGVGFCFVSNASLVSLNQYFRRYMPLATGVSLTGAGVGTFLLSLLVPVLLDTYGWRGSLFVLAGLALQLCITGAVLFPNNSIEPPKSVSISRKNTECCGEVTSLLTSKEFWFLNVSQLFFCVSLFSVVILFKDFTIVRGLGSSFPMAQAALGIGDITGRLFCGYVANRPAVNTVFFFFLVDVYCATIIMCLLAIQNTISLVACSLLLGLGLGCQVVLLCVAPVAVFGREKYLMAIGYVQTTAGIGALVGPPISSLLTDLTGSYTWTIVFLSATNLAASALVISIFFIEQKRKMKTLIVEIPEMEKWISIEQGKQENQDAKKIIS